MSPAASTPDLWSRSGLGWLAVCLLLCVADIGAEVDKGEPPNEEDALKKHEHEQRLYNDLFVATGYNSLIRPVVNTSESLQINFTLALSAIINVDAKNQVIITNVWLQMYWHDYQLTWNPKEYGGTEQIKVNYMNVWIPDIVLFNNADGNFEVSYNPNCVLSNDGSVTFIPPAIYTSSCTIDVMYFPFDMQECEMKFGSWTFEGQTLVYEFQGGEDHMILNDTMNNGAWDIVDGPGRIETVNDSITGQPKQIIVYVLKLRRKTLFYTVNLIIPCFLHALVSLCVFVIPAGRLGKKITLVANVLVSLVVFLLLLQKILPPSMTIPLIAKYFIFTFTMNVLEILVTVIIIFAHSQTPRTAIMPQWMCWLFLYKLPKYLFMQRPDHDNRWQQKNCTPPPSYPDTPQVPRANIMMRQAAAAESKKKKLQIRGVMLTRVDNRETERVLAWRHKFSQSRSIGLTGGGVNISSSNSGSCFSTDESPTAETREFNPPNYPDGTHSCMLGDSGLSQSDGSLDEDKTLETRCLDVAHVRDIRPIPLVLTKDIYSACNAIKFICRQMRNKDDYNKVLDDWKFVAAVLDRLLMIIFVLVSLGGTLGVLMNAPHNMDAS